MKVQLKNIMKAYSGKCDGLVYYYDSSLDRMICRRYVRPRISSQNLRMAAISKNLKALKPSEEYITDLKYYAALAKRPGRRLSWSNVYVKLMHAVAAAWDLDLAVLDKATIYELDLPCISVAKAIKAGILEPVVGYERLDKGM